MNHRLQGFLEAHPSFGWISSFASLATGWFSWFVEHADDFAKVAGLFAATFGLIAGWYTMRIQRRAWRRGDTKAPFQE